MTWEFLADIIKNKIDKVKKKQGSITSEQLTISIEQIFSSLRESDMFEDDFENIEETVLGEWLTKIKLRLKSIIVTTIEPDSAIDDRLDYDRWIDSRQNVIEWNYFNRYAKYLKNIGRPSDVVQSTENSTKGIIERLGDPQKAIDSLQKGLVLGSVQSGKTANFNGVINRAIDAGYDMIIVFSGIMEDLRFQTQKRINNDVLGIGELGNQINQVVGVGNIQQFSRSGIHQISSITSSATDFRKSLVGANFDFTNQRILVCKKNVSVLTNIIYWLKSSMPHGHNKLNKSLLIIDDEADNASLNNLGHKGATYASKVNGHLRALLDLFKRRSYLGYTATPFANILQDQHGAMEQQDAWVIPFRYNGQVKQIECSLSPGLFPDKFIYKLATPSSYLGPKRFFSNGREREGDKKIPLIETIPTLDLDEVVVFGENDSTLSKSLIDAIDCFVLSIALRDSRRSVIQSIPGYTDHHTMLVHISRLISVQNVVATNISKYVDFITSRIKKDNISDPSGVYEKLRLQWNKFFVYKVENIISYLPEDYNSDGLIPKTWDDISKLIPNAVNNIMVKAINSETGDKLIYPDGGNKKYIAVGGNRLSRGFTLEGLTINYFLRDTNYYDALLQMGRWFGYRPGYIDACRLFIDFSTEEKYNFITTALTELEEQIENMEYQKKKPKEFELRIRKHPDVLKITRLAILKNANEVRFSFQDMVQQSTIFKIEKNTLSKSWTAFKSLFNAHNFVPTDQEGGFYTLDTNKHTLFEFLNLPNTYLEETFMTKFITSYIDLCVGVGKLTNWKIAIKRTGSGDPIDEDNIKLQLTKRSAPKEDDERGYYMELKNEQIFRASGKSMNIMTSGMDESLGLPAEKINKAISDFRAYKKKKFLENNKSEEVAEEDSQKTTIPGWIFRKVRPENEGLLLIYLIDLKCIFNTEELMSIAKEKGINPLIPLVGYALSFPSITDDPGAIYLANDYQDEGISQNEDTEIPEDFNNEINDII
ncbi:Z1 domain-containing protein [Pedobacter gandavensis]|uniref:Z1 domain-containing protein n=1 Tax=Pedobacter gandavensis TaxID=2679963 RepID=UPI00292E17A3|nr:Z1 domain-containing protein [Pedobacter gandavensis]